MFTLSIGIAFFSYDLATYSWILILFVYLAVSRIFKLPKADDDI
jgi:hypothetical protein